MSNVSTLLRATRISPHKTLLPSLVPHTRWFSPATCLRSQTQAQIQPGDKIPEATLFYSNNPEADGVCAIPQKITTAELFKNKKVVLVSVPAAFSPTCQGSHIPGFIEKLADLKAKGVDTVAVLAADTVFAMDAWGKHLKVGKDIIMLSDPYVELSKKLGLAFETRGGALEMGPRTRRSAIIANDGTVKWVGVDLKGLENSTAEAVLAHL
ncbi:hypothetical protein SpCBS45565_g08015 [Spizellomyces sp. 'palustris']|nr:hypothetical protein SpCBS45565_g08015 [Spizellomyces sp. 'palustris']